MKIRDESGLEKKKFILKLPIWNYEDALAYLEGPWKTFCRVAMCTVQKDILPWVYPSIDFTASN
jgi:hypothetical protein